MIGTIYEVGKGGRNTLLDGVQRMLSFYKPDRVAHFFRGFRRIGGTDREALAVRKRYRSEGERKKRDIGYQRLGYYGKLHDDVVSKAERERKARQRRAKLKGRG
jgi:hypothetical protein